ncbi:hypothetical protein [Stenoxybacter acetivorans]|uniref:hypothetical protein n=1 Tax=Stenoxybacter acetivorans TaxID=422441 RepID=UPI000564148F|nr:hypothetical protein [Stenoxybacter acetivorans]
MNYGDVVEMLTVRIPETISKGSLYRAPITVKNSTRKEYVFNGNLVALTKAKGSNDWIVTAFDLYEDANAKGYVKNVPTDTSATTPRTDTGASYAAQGSRSSATSSANSAVNSQGKQNLIADGSASNATEATDTQAHSQRGRGLVAESTESIAHRNNVWIVAAFELHQDGAKPAGSVDTDKATHSKPTLARQRMGASDVDKSITHRNQIAQAVRDAVGEHAKQIDVLTQQQALNEINKRQ